MRKGIKWIGIAVMTPVLLFIILAALLYVPPIQNWVAQKVVSIASEKTGMEISVGHVNLEFPLDLGIDDFRVLHPNDSVTDVTDTIADVRHLTVNVRLLPLLKKKVVIEELSFRQTKINTNGFIDDLRIKGQFQELWLASKGIDLDKETVRHRCRRHHPDEPGMGDRCRQPQYQALSPHPAPARRHHRLQSRIR